MSIRLVTVLFVCLWLGMPAALPAAEVREYGTQYDVSVVARMETGRMELWYRNKSPAWITVYMWFTKMINCTPDRQVPFTMVLRPRQRVRACILRQQDRARRWDTYYKYNFRYGRLRARHGGTVYRLPYARGRSFPIIQGYYGRITHKGEYACSLDFGMPVGTPIHAARGGVVARTVDKFRGYGFREEYKLRTNQLLIQHDDGTIAEYSHIKTGSIVVRVGQRVEAGTLLARCGLVGYTTPHPHLHFCVYHPVSGKRIRTLPVRFRVTGGKVLQLVEGRSYRAE